MCWTTELAHIIKLWYVSVFRRQVPPQNQLQHSADGFASKDHALHIYEIILVKSLRSFGTAVRKLQKKRIFGICNFKSTEYSTKLMYPQSIDIKDEELQEGVQGCGRRAKVDR